MVFVCFIMIALLCTMFWHPNKHGCNNGIHALLDHTYLQSVSRSCMGSIKLKSYILASQVMGSSKASAVAKDMDDMRAWGHGTYYGESVEVLAALQVQSC